MSVEIHNDVRQTFGPVDSIANLAGHVSTFGVKTQVVVPVKFDDLPSHLNGDVTGAQIPANAFITSIIVLPSSTTFDGDRTFNLNLVQEDGTAITTVHALTVANLNSGLVLPNSAADITDATVGAAAGFVEMATTGGTIDATAGETSIVIEYVQRMDLF